MAKLRNPVWERLRTKFTRRGDCWIWEASTNPNGYGSFTEIVNGRSKSNRAHRKVYEVLVGEIPRGMDLDHLCRNRPCVNPAHLEVVTRQENLLRSELTIAHQNARKAHCKNGHEFTALNTYVHPKRGTRDCRTCRKLAKLRWAASPK